MWFGDSSCIIYFDKKTKEIYENAVCPSCGANMAVIPKVLKGMPEDSSLVIRSEVRPL